MHSPVQCKSLHCVVDLYFDFVWIKDANGCMLLSSINPLPSNHFENLKPPTSKAFRNTLLFKVKAGDALRR